MGDPLANAKMISAATPGSGTSDPLANAKPVDLPGSVFDKPTMGQRLKRIGKALPELAVGTALPVAAGIGAGMVAGPEASGPAAAATRIGAQAVAGAVTPYAEAAVDKLEGGHPAMPSWREALKSAAFNAGFSALGEGVGAIGGKAAAVKDQIEGLPIEAQTPQNVKAAMRTRDFWQKLGATPEQADAAIAHPEDAEAFIQQAAQHGQQYRAAYQTVLDNTRAEFKNRYSPFEQYFAQKATPGETAQLRTTIDKALEETAQRTGDVTTTQKMYGGIPPQVAERLNGLAYSPTLQHLRDVRTTIRGMLNGSGLSNPARAALNQITTEIGDVIDKTMAREGAAPETIAALKAVDQDYGRFQETINHLDPRSGQFGKQVADLLYDPAVKNPELAANFIHMAERAEAANPGQVMPQLRAAFLDKAIQDTRGAAQGRPVEEMKLLQKLQKQWGSEQGLRQVTMSLFGKDSALSNPTKLSEVLGALSSPDEIAAKVGRGMNPFQMPPWLIRLGATYATYSLMTGSLRSPWTDMHRDPARFLAGMVGIYAGMKVASAVYGSGNAMLQRSYTKFLLNPTPESFRTVASAVGASAGALSTLPTK